MKIIIYRGKETNEITNYHDMPKNVNNIEDLVKTYNENPKMNSVAEIVDLETNSIAYYFYTMKTREIKDECKSLRDIEEQLRELASDIDDRLFWIEKDLRSKGND